MVLRQLRYHTPVGYAERGHRKDLLKHKSYIPGKCQYIYKKILINPEDYYPGLTFVSLIRAPSIQLLSYLMCKLLYTIYYAFHMIREVSNKPYLILQ